MGDESVAAKVALRVRRQLGAGKRWGRELTDPLIGEVRGCDEASMAWPGLGCLFVAVATLALGLSQAEATYRLTFQNGTSVDVQSFEDLGDAIRYQRYGGTVVVPKAHLTTITGCGLYRVRLAQGIRMTTPRKGP